jgi:AcrR family transcriptional regulator
MPAALEMVVPLRSKRHDQRRVRVETLQRTRLTAALIEVVEATGNAEPTVSQILVRARVSRKTFYDVFRDREDCFLAAFDEISARARAAMAQAYARERSWRAGVRAALSCLLTLIEQQPRLARLCVVHSSGAGKRVRTRRIELMTDLADVVDRGREAGPPGAELPRITAEMVVGGIHAVIHGRLMHQDTRGLNDLLGALMSMIVLPYLGPGVAREERGARVTTVAAIPPARPGQDNEDPLRGLRMRLTYRTVRVLNAVGGQPGASNREIAAAAGISDEGQVSKLLARLVRLGLIENQDERHRRGCSNAWLLTADGARLEQATHPPFT